jgi:methanogenic corrinoid protein MtbC1
MLAAVAAATVAQDEGMCTVNLGADTPLDSMILAAEELQADLVWLSVSVAESTARPSADVGRLLAALARREAPLVVGGVRAEHLQMARHERLYAGSSMADFA